MREDNFPHIFPYGLIDLQGPFITPAMGRWIKPQLQILPVDAQDPGFGV